MLTVNDRIKSIMEERKITQYKLAKAIGAPLTTVSGWFVKGNEPRDNYMVKVAEFLGVSPAYLRYGSNSDELVDLQAVENAHMTPIIVEIVPGFPDFLGPWSKYMILPGTPQGSIAMYVTDDAMSPDLSYEDLVVFTPYKDKADIDHKEYVVIRDKFNTPTVRQFGIYADGTECLIALNRHYPDISIPDRSTIAGIVFEMWAKVRKRGQTIS